MNSVSSFLFTSLRYLGFSFASFAVGAVLSAAGVTASATAPSANILAATTAKEPASTIGWKHDGSANQWTGITFNVSKRLKLEKIAFSYADAGSGAANAEVTLQLIRLAPTGSFAERVGKATLLQTDTFTLPSALPVRGWLTFDLTDTELSASSNAYAYILSFKQKANNRFFSFVRGNGDAKGVITVGADNAAFRSENGGDSYAALGNARAETAAFPHLYFLGASALSTE